MIAFVDGPPPGDPCSPGLLVGIWVGSGAGIAAAGAAGACGTLGAAGIVGAEAAGIVKAAGIWAAPVDAGFDGAGAGGIAGFPVAAGRFIMRVNSPGADDAGAAVIDESGGLSPGSTLSVSVGGAASAAFAGVREPPTAPAPNIRVN